jgi:hypothetical protein
MESIDNTGLVSVRLMETESTSMGGTLPGRAHSPTPDRRGSNRGVSNESPSVSECSVDLEIPRMARPFLLSTSHGPPALPTRGCRRSEPGVFGPSLRIFFFEKDFDPR